MKNFKKLIFIVLFYLTLFLNKNTCFAQTTVFPTDSCIKMVQVVAGNNYFTGITTASQYNLGLTLDSGVLQAAGTKVFSDKTVRNLDISSPFNLPAGTITISAYNFGIDYNGDFIVTQGLPASIVIHSAANRPFRLMAGHGQSLSYYQMPGTGPVYRYGTALTTHTGNAYPTEGGTDGFISALGNPYTYDSASSTLSGLPTNYTSPLNSSVLKNNLNPTTSGVTGTTNIYSVTNTNLSSGQTGSYPTGQIVPYYWTATNIVNTDSLVFFSSDPASDHIFIYVTTTVPCNSLAVDLIDFTASLNNQNMATINWNTGVENDLSGFNLEYSDNGGVSWLKISDISKKGSNSNYSYQHIYNKTNTVQYRLKMNNIDGSFTYSKIATVKFKNSNIFSITPNPSSDYININNGSINKMNSIQIYNSNAELIMNLKNYDISKSINISNLKTGIYLIKTVDNEGNSKTTKIVKK